MLFWNTCPQAIPQGVGISQNLPLPSFGIEVSYVDCGITMP